MTDSTCPFIWCDDAHRQAGDWSTNLQGDPVRSHSVDGGSVDGVAEDYKNVGAWIEARESRTTQGVEFTQPRIHLRVPADAELTVDQARELANLLTALAGKLAKIEAL